jgi:hypothetical protein
MTQHPRNMNVLPTSCDGWDLAWLLILAVAALMVTATAFAADKSSKPYRVSVSRLGAADDLDVEIRVRRELGKVEELKRLSVHMAGGVAHLFGPVPSADLKKKAIAIAAGVPGVLEVRTDEVYLVKPPPAAKPLVLPLEGDSPTQTRSASPNSFSGSVETLPSRDPPLSIPAAPNTTPRTAPPSPPPLSPPVLGGDKGGVAESPSVPSAPQRVTLLAPETVTAPARTSEPAVLTANPHTPPSTSSIAAAVDRLRQGDRRFRSIRTEVHGSTVRVLSGDAPGENVMAFVQAVRHLPGVRHVILKDTSLRPN